MRVTTLFMTISYILINFKLLVVLKFFLYFSFIIPFVFFFFNVGIQVSLCTP